MINAEVGWKAAVERIKLPESLLRKVAKLILGVDNERLQDTGTIPVVDYLCLLVFSWLRTESSLQPDQAEEVLSMLHGDIVEFCRMFDDMADNEEVSPLHVVVLDRKYVTWSGHPDFFDPATGQWYSSMTCPAISARLIDIAALAAKIVSELN